METANVCKYAHICSKGTFMWMLCRFWWQRKSTCRETILSPGHGVRRRNTGIRWLYTGLYRVTTGKHWQKHSHLISKTYIFKKNQKLICGLDIHCYTTVLPNFDHFVLILLKTGIFNRTFNPADYTSEARTGSTQTDGWDTVANSNTDGTGERWRVHFHSPALQRPFCVLQ